DSDLVPVDEEPVQKGKRVKRPAKKSTTKPAACVIIREAPVETKSKSKEKEKEKVDVTRGKGIELLSEIALTKEAQMKEELKGLSQDTSYEGTSDKPGVPDVTEDDSTESESESWGNDEDDSNNNKNQVMKAVSRRMRVTSKNLIQCKKKKLKMMIKKRRSLFILPLPLMIWDDVADFAIALRMFTRSLVIQKRVEDLQLGVKSYQKQINITKPDTTRPYLRKRHSYTPYKDPQGFIYVDDFKRNIDALQRTVQVQ
ncbi:hypothetical protein Tco_1152094, partial [Tanacetum coccineum]